MIKPGEFLDAISGKETIYKNIYFGTISSDLRVIFDGEVQPSKKDIARINYTPKEGDRVVIYKQGQIYLIMGQLGDKVGGGDERNIIPISFANGIGTYWSTYVTVTFNLPLAKDNLNVNYLAFKITGKEMGISKTYAATGVMLLDDYRIGIACDDFKNLDDFITISYDADKGNLAGIDGKKVASFDGQFAPMYMSPKINLMQTYTSKAVATPTYSAIKNAYLAADMTNIDQQVPIPTGISESFFPVSVNVAVGTVFLASSITGNLTAPPTFLKWAEQFTFDASDAGLFNNPNPYIVFDGLYHSVVNKQTTMNKAILGTGFTYSCPLYFSDAYMTIETAVEVTI